MDPSESRHEPINKSPDAPTSPPSFPKRLLRRVMYMVTACLFSGALLGYLVDGLIGAVVWATAGAFIGIFLGVIVGAYAWVLETPLKGAIRGGGLFAATMGPLALIGGLAKQGWGGLANALAVALMAVA